VQRVEGGFIYSASDLNNDLECRRLTWLEHQLALGKLPRPERDAAFELIAGKGDAHEARFLETLREQHGEAMVEFETRAENTLAGLVAADAQTFAAMASGAPVIYQATFFDGTFIGRTDFLRRVETPSVHWPWSYEVIDTKLALHAKAYFLLQLCNYSEHLARLQGTAPVWGHLVLGSGMEARFRIDDYAAYYRHQKQSFLARAGEPAEAYPAEIGHCNICRWSDRCEAVREADDYLGIVAGMRTSQIDRLATSNIVRIGELGLATDEQRPFGMAEASFETLRAQAKLQHRQRTEHRHFYELLRTRATSTSTWRAIRSTPPSAGSSTSSACTSARRASTARFGRAISPTNGPPSSNSSTSSSSGARGIRPCTSITTRRTKRSRCAA
jgi:uncharacterized protein